jgi:hypothetical protein
MKIGLPVIKLSQLRWLKPTDMTIHWKALEVHSLMVPLVFRFNHFGGKMNFLNFSQKSLYFFLLQVQPNSPSLVYDTLLELYLHDIVHESDISVCIIVSVTLMLTNILLQTEN